MKTQVTIKTIRSMGNNYYCGYGDLSFLHIEPTFYTSGIYGWNFDTYVITATNGYSVVISTGYRHMPGTRIPSEKLDTLKRRFAEMYAKYREGIWTYGQLLENEAFYLRLFADELLREVK